MRNIVVLYLALAVHFVQAMDRQSLWVSRKTVPFNYNSNPTPKFPLTTHEDNIIMVALSDITSDSTGIYEYNSRTNQWTNVYPTTQFVNAEYAAITPKDQKGEYIILTNEGIYDFSLSQKKCNTIVLDLNGKYNGGKISCMNNALHIIYGKNHHTILNLTTLDCKINYTFNNKYSGSSMLCDNDGFMVYGGCEETGILSYKWSKSIIQYTNNTWTELPLRLPEGMSNFGTIRVSVSCRQRYLIMFGGDNSLGLSKNIYIYDSQLKTWGLSQYTLPCTGKYESILIKNTEKSELLTFGYVNQFFNETTTSMQVPYYLIMLMNSFNCRLEAIHCFGPNGSHISGHVHELLKEWDLPFSSYTGENNDAVATKKAMVHLNYAKRYLHQYRHYYINPWNKKYVELFSQRIGKLRLCNTCGKVSDAYSENYNHLTKQHFDKKLTEEELKSALAKDNAMSGENFIYEKKDTDNGEKPFKCKLCTKSFTHARTAMKHAKDVHQNMYNKLL